MRIDPPHPAAENLMAMMCFNSGQLKHLEHICELAEMHSRSGSSWRECAVHYQKQFAARRAELEAQMNQEPGRNALEQQAQGKQPDIIQPFHP